MKPQSPIQSNSKRADTTTPGASIFPLTVCHYHANTLPALRGSCARPLLPSFRNISRDYFRKEAASEFGLEMIAFIAITLTAGVAVVSSAHALMQIMQGPGL
ncbi:MAG: hypothetical protein M3R59_03615 [Verrucomicrobiota bacterium]|nr:hypothetical protein [Verrucomicrobiota bacterium]